MADVSMDFDLLVAQVGFSAPGYIAIPGFGSQSNDSGRQQHNAFNTEPTSERRVPVLDQSTVATSMAPPPRRKPKAKTLRGEDWKPFKDRILGLLVLETQSLSQVRTAILEEYGFDATERQYKSILRKWNIGINVRKPEMKAIVRKRQNRLVREPNKRAQVFELRGEIVPEEKITRWMGREEIPADAVYSPASGAPTPAGLDYWTPKSVNDPSTPSVSTPVLDREQLIAPSQHWNSPPQSPNNTTYLAPGTPLQGQSPRLPRQSLASSSSELANHSGEQHNTPSPRRSPSPSSQSSPSPSPQSSPSPALSTITTNPDLGTPFQGQTPHPSHPSPVVPLAEPKEVRLLHRLSSLESRCGVGSYLTLDPFDDLFILAINQGRYTSAETYARGFLSASRKTHGDHDHRTGRGLSILGESLRRQGHGLQALMRFQEASDVFKRTRRPEHEHTLENELWTALAHLGLGHSDKAFKIFRGTEKTALGVFGPEHEIILNVQTYLIDGLLGLKQYPEAEQRLNLLMTRLQDHSSTLNSSFLTGCRIRYARLLRETSRLEKAAEVLEISLQESMKTNGQEHPLALHVMYELAKTYVDHGRIPEALDTINICISGRERVLGPDHPDSKKARGVRDKILRKMGHHNQ